MSKTNETETSADKAVPGRRTFFDPEHVERSVPERPWRRRALIAALVLLGLTLGWELYWRGQGLSAGDFKNTAALWAQERRKAKGDATVVIGSSRAFFDTDLDVWEDLTGVRPVQLSLEGTSPRIFLQHLADDEEFHGLVLVGVTVPLFFTGAGGLREDVLDYVRDESPSQRIDHLLSMQLERAFAFIDESTRPKTKVYQAVLPLREGMTRRFFPHKLAIHEADRNTEMWGRLAEDEAYAQQAKDIWVGMVRRFTPPPGPDGGPPPPMPDEAIDAVIAEVKANVDKIRARGGDVVFLRFPYEGFFQQLEDSAFPRERFWDRLVEKTDAVGVTWHDHPQLQGYSLPEWSHLDPRDAERYTRALAPIIYAELERKSGKAWTRASLQK
jgi:hypothetical protein